MTDLAARLTQAERDQSHPNSVPKDAATLILIDRSTATPKVLVGRRHHSHKFLPGKYVFPGGRVEPADRLMPSAGALDPHAQAALMRDMRRPSAMKARALALAAIRETYEETGLFLGARLATPPRAPHPHWAAFEQKGIHPDLSALHFIARAITPPRRPRRFDTRFFAVDASAVAHKIEGASGPDSELVELVWMPIDQAEELDLPTITKVVLTELEARSAAGFGHDLPVPFYRMLHGRFYRTEL